MNDDELYTCAGCSDLLTLDTPHDCPVTGTTHLLEERGVTDDDRVVWDRWFAYLHEQRGDEPAPDRWQEERADVLDRFTLLLSAATGDGSVKRQRGEKPPWYDDDSHEAALFSHLNKWKHGEKMDEHSGVHPLVHLAWRALAIACRESGFVPLGQMSDPREFTDYPEEW